MKTIEFFIDIFYLYLALGAVFAIFFLRRGAATIDEAAKGISWKTNVLLFPGTMALWPVLLKKWLQETRKTR